MIVGMMYDYSSTRRVLALTLVVCALASGAAAAGPLLPAQAQNRFKVADGLQVNLFAGEPAVRQPVTMTFDDRGRLWVIQYLQYPAPAGLKPVEVDRYLRTKYDRVPEPPPKGPRGADRITIVEDTDGDGRADSFKDFVGGLNLASGLAIGHGGVFVGQAPYLLFYPDRDGDDRPDGDPEVLLKGFGMEDAHAVVNSMQWGPDGWLYGAQGSTVTADIRGVGFQQGIWRYHPRTRKFELFSEGGGNTWGLDFDKHGNVIAGTNYGERVLLHQVQGGYYVKGFSKHGPLHNPFAYGYFDHAPHQGLAGGHVTCGGVVYQADALGANFRDTYIAANLLSNAVYWHAIEPDRSTFKTRYQGTLLSTDDPWFRPVDCAIGPDGALYVADWYDQRANHVIPEDTWDRSNGRIWRIAAKGSKPAVGLRMAGKSSDELIGMLGQTNAWYAREARRILAERRDAATYPRLRKMLQPGGDQRLAIQALWALCASGGWNEALSRELLDHPAADVRAWAVRLIGDEGAVSADVQARLVALAHSETSPNVRSQLACTCKRLPGTASLPVVEAMLARAEDATDPHIPLLLWWAIEDKSLSDRDRVLALATSAGATQRSPILANVIVERLARRYLAENTSPGYAACAKLLAAAPDDAQRRKLVAAMENELAGRRLPSVPEPLEKPLAELWRRAGDDVGIIRFAVRLGSPAAYDRALAMVADPKQPASVRLPLVELIGHAGRDDAVPVLLALLADSESEPVRVAGLTSLARFSDRRIARDVLARYGHMSPALRTAAIGLLCSRPAWSKALLDEVGAGRIDPAQLGVDHLRQIVQHNDPQLTQLVERRWGKVRQATPGEKLAQIVVLARILSEGSGQADSGHKLFTKHCGACHALFGEGGKVGPDLTGADRKNRDLLLTTIVDPSGTIRPEYVTQVVALADGRLLTGVVVESTGQTITLADVKAQKIVLARSEIDSIKESPQSLMPEKLLEPLAPQELRDLFRYLQSDTPLGAKPATTSAGR